MIGQKTLTNAELIAADITISAWEWEGMRGGASAVLIVSIIMVAMLGVTMRADGEYMQVTRARINNTARQHLLFVAFINALPKTHNLILYVTAVARNNTD